MLSQRLRNDALRQRIVSAEEACTWIEDGMTVGISGFTSAGDVKVVPSALVERVKKEGKPFKINLYTGASISAADGLMAEAGIINCRLPYQSDRRMRKAINRGEVHYLDQHLSHTAEMLRSGAIHTIDVALIEAIAITEEGHIIPSTSLGNSHIYAQQAQTIIVELNLAQNLALEGLHDIYDPGEQGHRLPIPLTSAGQRIGSTKIEIDIEKIKGIVITNRPDFTSEMTPPDAETEQMAEHLVQFLMEEVEQGHLPKHLEPLQSGVGSVANAVFYGFLKSDLTDLEVYSEVLQDSVFELIDAGKIKVASGCAFTLSPARYGQVMSNLDKYRDRIVLRPQEMSNNPGIIRRLGLIAINTALEVDIYGNVNSTHVMGTQMMNGIGGSGDFARNSRLTFFCTKSYAKDGKISSIVPMVSHVDHTEHDVDVVVTEQGLADLRGLAPRQRAEQIIEHCAHPDYRPQLRAYLEEASALGGHTPHVLEKALSWHVRFQQTGTMKDETTVH
ncbi:acetyl-CoA hydrolase/transferase family protein [Heliophilum fasciatum]|uniref:Succinyl-CoA:acetate CoA-transferase n=1 Tax=Heliophilum fasciatum TaxID=35700 RepID=A0A4R2RLY6_9FIRM|nr:acetyl-CoA hydrolase/transferase family protein [Heliophilum fasciatum]MCW2277612.1 succinyl-CoA:acetate CoA-transferase [Heliophilum fasciatum]TCP64960.1 succinyl-CoA:acetate CoA-transferase [Heliophilum fasciatum]